LKLTAFLTTARFLTAIFCCLLILETGCSKGSGSGGELFKSADPEAKSLWEASVAASKTNGFVTGILALQKLRQKNLSAEQQAAVEARLTELTNGMYDAANKGDAKAAEQIKELRKLSSRP
jgi:hypothetical protein